MPTRKTPDDAASGANASHGDDFQAPRAAITPTAATPPPTRRAALETPDALPVAQAPLFGDFADHVPTVRRVIARDHDVILFMFPGKLNLEQIERVRAHVREAFPPGTNVLIMSDGVNVEVIGRTIDDVPDAAIAAIRDRFATSGPAGTFDAIGFGRALLALADDTIAARLAAGELVP